MLHFGSKDSAAVRAAEVVAHMVQHMANHRLAHIRCMDVDRNLNIHNPSASVSTSFHR